MLALLCLLGMQDPAYESAERKLRSMKISLDFKGADLESVIRYLSEVTDLNVLLDKFATEKEQAPVSVQLKDVSVKSALALILRPRGLSAVWRDGVILITTPEQEPLVLEIYDVRDLTTKLCDFPGVEITLATDTLGASIAGVDDPVAQPDLPLEEILKTHTGGKSWDDSPKVSLKLQNGLLVVKQSQEVHAQIRLLLSQFRR